jgi:hypothetical protein
VKIQWINGKEFHVNQNCSPHQIWLFSAKFYKLRSFPHLEGKKSSGMEAINHEPFGYLQGIFYQGFTLKFKPLYISMVLHIDQLFILAVAYYYLYAR